MQRIGLEGSWELVRMADGSRRPMAVPGDIMSALQAAGEIPDPYWDRNEAALQWIGREDWRIERDFEVDAAALDRETVFLEALVLDTIAEVEVNGHVVGSSRNMFRRLRADVRGVLKAGRNRIAVTIASPERAAALAAVDLPYPVPASEYPVFSPHRNLIRKAQCMAGWDWGPCLMTGGIYDGIALVAHDGPRIEYATTGMRRRGEDWEVDVGIDLLAAAEAEVALEADLAGSRAERKVLAPAGSSRHSLTLSVKRPELWWPAGYGAQPLYDLVVRVRPGAGSGDGAEIKKRLGFRELEVVTEEDPWGKSMKFRVNGREVFAKGANWIPADALPSRWTRERHADLLGSAVQANMNCLRVWGGGRYESDDFYELCDEFGLLIWQDCMFSCALYPSSPAFLAEVEAEMRHQVLRLKDHPSLALWCGNNEALGAINWYEQSRASPARYIADYDRLTEGTAGRVVRELDPDRCWWPSSPSSGPNDYSDNWHSDGRGDMHFWSVWHEGKPFSAYLTVKPRFCSEFGFQSLSSPEIVASFAPEGQRNVTSPAMEHHQRHPRGNSIIVETMLRYFRMPTGFEEALYLSQVQQALAMRTAVDYWRSLRPRCMGTLYWQLNDVWPVASWSSLEYDGSWKLLHHEARRFFDPLRLALILKEDRAEAHVINDGTGRLEAGLSLALRRFDGSLASEARLDATLEPASAALVWSLPLAALPAGPEELFLDGTLRAGSPAPETRRGRLFLTEPKRCDLVDPGLEYAVEEDVGGPSLRIRASAPAFWVAPGLNAGPSPAPRGRFEDSGFDLGPGEERVLRFVPRRGEAMPRAAELARALHIMNLKSTY